MSSYHPHTHFFLAVTLVLVSTLVVAADTSETQQLLWQQTPIAVQLSVGDERRIQFRAPVSVGVPATLQSVLRTQSVNGTVYLLSHRPFSKTRMLVREIDGGQVYLLDVMANEGDADNRPIAIHLPATAPSEPAFDGASSAPAYVLLTRFAAQQLYAPQRLLHAMPGVRRVPVQSEPVPLVPGGIVEATPLIAWRAKDLYITAVKLQNRSKRSQTLDPRTLRGDWLSATFQHARLLPAGSDADSTAVYLLSAQPFAAAL